MKQELESTQVRVDAASIARSQLMDIYNLLSSSGIKNHKIYEAVMTLDNELGSFITAQEFSIQKKKKKMKDNRRERQIARQLKTGL